MNKRSIFVLFSFSLVFLIFSCGGNSSNTGASNTEPETGERAQAASVIEFRKEEEPKAMAFLITGYYEYAFIFDKVMSEPDAHKGEWIKFEEDFTYTYGKNSKVLGSGKFHHSIKSGMLVMLDSDRTKIPREYELKMGNSMIILVGRNTYGNNAVQMKLLKVNERPG